MSVYTLFMSPLHQAFSDNVNDPEDSQVVARLRGDVRQNILYQHVEQYSLDDGSTRAISYANYTLTEWAFIVLRVVGEIKVTTVAKDTDGSTDISANLPCYGTALFPGILVLSTYNVSSFTVESLADDTTVQVFAGIAAEDDDSRLDDNE